MAGRGRRGFKRPYHPHDSRGFATLNPEDKEPLNDYKRIPILDTQYWRKHTENVFAFDSKFVRGMLSNTKVLMIGDSLMRGLYKDMVTWVQSDELSTDKDLKAKAEDSFMGDRQIDLTKLTDDKVFRQAREYQNENVLIQYIFTTRVMKDDMETLIQQMLGIDGYPDVILINSMIWDLTRYFKVSTNSSYSDSRYQKKIEIEAIQKYLDRTSMFLRRLRAILPPHTMVIWVCFPHCRPSRPRGDGRGAGMQHEPLAIERNHFIRSVMIDGSFRISQVVRNAGYDVLDVGFYMRNHAFYHYQKMDGMHWLPPGVRLMSQLVIQFLAKSWGIDATPHLSKLESRQDEDDLKVGTVQLHKHTYHYTKDVPKLTKEIAQRTFEALGESDQYAMQNVLEQSRMLTALIQPTTKYKKQMPVHNPIRGGESPPVYPQLVRLGPRVTRETAHDVDELASELAALIGNEGLGRE